ncbi:MAG: mandelate racemase/muconate lactonizing enzyme family protein [Halodesulfurarchaeum sp.]
MEIEDVTATTHEIPVEAPHIDEPFQVPITFTQVDTDEGITGYGLTGYMWPYSTREFINREAFPVIEGENPLNTERVFHRLRRQLNLRDQTGVWSSGVSAIDLALWDIKGKQYGEPVWRLLGGAQNPAPAYVTFGLPDFSKDELVEVATDLVSQGEHRLKMVVGTGHVSDSDAPADVQEDARRVRAVREAVGEDAEIMIDANMTFSVDEAVDLCRRIEDVGITWFEEPIYGNDPELLANLRGRTSIPIGAGQYEGHKYNHRELMEAGAIDIAMPNVAMGAGFTEGKRIAALADSFNLKIANGGGWPHHNAHLHAGVSNGWRVEFHYLMWQAGEAIYQDPYTIDGGEVTLPETPGLGLEPDWETLEEYETS